MKVTRAATGTGSSEPRSASKRRQASIMQPAPAIAAMTAPAIEYQWSGLSAGCTCGHSTARPYEQTPRIITRRPVLSHLFPATRLSTHKAYPDTMLRATVGRSQFDVTDLAPSTEVLRMFTLFSGHHGCSSGTLCCQAVGAAFGPQGR